MRRVVLLCLGVVSCASPDLPRVDGVPEDPGHNPPGLPVAMNPEAPAVPNDSASSAEASESSEPARADAGLSAGVTPTPPSTTAPTPASSTTAPESSGEHGASMNDDTFEGSTGEAIGSGEPAPPVSDAGVVEWPCEVDAGFDGGLDSGLDGGSVSPLPGDCHGH